MEGTKNNVNKCNFCSSSNLSLTEHTFDLYKNNVIFCCNKEFCKARLKTIEKKDDNNNNINLIIDGFNIVNIEVKVNKVEVENTSSKSIKTVSRYLINCDNIFGKKPRNPTTNISSNIFRSLFGVSNKLKKSNECELEMIT